jgi:lysophospholipase L1-like esterase
MNQRPTFVLFGDSITERSFALTSGWALPIASAYATSVDIVNRGFSGYNTRWANAVVKQLITHRLFNQLEVVVVFFGANDIVSPGLDEQWSRQHVPVDEYVANLRSIVAHVRTVVNNDQTAPHVVLVGPPAIDERAWHAATVHRWQHATPAEQIPLNRTLENARAYSVAAKQLAGELDVPFVDLCHDMLAAPEWQLMLNDGLHLSESGAAFLAPRVQAAINSLAHGAFASEKMRPQLPLHSELTSENWREKLAGVIPGSWVK